MRKSLGFVVLLSLVVLIFLVLFGFFFSDFEITGRATSDNVGINITIVNSSSGDDSGENTGTSGDDSGSGISESFEESDSVTNDPEINENSEENSDSSNSAGSNFSPGITGSVIRDFIVVPSVLMVIAFLLLGVSFYLMYKNYIKKPIKKR